MLGRALVGPATRALLLGMVRVGPSIAWVRNCVGPMCLHLYCVSERLAACCRRMSWCVCVCVCVCVCDMQTNKARALERERLLVLGRARVIPATRALLLGVARVGPSIARVCHCMYHSRVVFFHFSILY